ncbi:MAG: glycoside hydrolase family 11 protein [Polyangiaceae bacterium]|nr:glycoside hydrolase family 11 protein [Polyangiaceae bacterium]
MGGDTAGTGSGKAGGGGGGTGGNSTTGGTTSSGGQMATGGTSETGGAVATGGTSETGGAPTGGVPLTGGAPTGGTSETGGAPTGGTSETGGAPTGGAETGGGPAVVDCNATMPTSGDEVHSGTYGQGGSGNLAWWLWTNGAPGSLTTYGVPAFSLAWDNSGDSLGRMGFEWGNSGKPYTDYGTVKADYVFTKSGSAGQYSFIGIYGWSNNPCVEPGFRAS